jgi:hypothetical protein
MDMNSELTDKEMDRIDHIQQLTYDYILKMLPDGKAVEYDLDMIDDVIEAVWGAIKDREICTEMEFYPYRESGIEGPVEGDDVPDGWEDPSVDCYDFYWSDIALADECGEKCCKMCGNYNEETGRCSLDRPC